MIARVIILLVSGMVCLLAPSVGIAQEQESTDTLRPVGGIESNPFADALKLADSTKRQVLVIFRTDWCRWCKALEESTLSSPEVATLSDRIIVMPIDADSDTATAARFRIRHYPTSVLTNDQGQEVDRIIGYLSPDRFARLIAEYVAGQGTVSDLERRFKEKPKEYGFLFALGSKYADRGEFDRARDLLEKLLSLDKDNGSGRVDDALFLLARLHREEENWYKSIEGFRRLVRRFPDSEWREDSDIYIAWLYTQVGDTTEAVKQFHSFMKEHSGSTEVQWAGQQIERLERASMGTPPNSAPTDTTRGAH